MRPPYRQCPSIRASSICFCVGTPRSTLPTCSGARQRCSRGAEASQKGGRGVWKLCRRDCDETWPLRGRLELEIEFALPSRAVFVVGPDEDRFKCRDHRGIKLRLDPLCEAQPC